jgi:hypothetical protein
MAELLLYVRKPHGQETEINVSGEGDINELAGEDAVMKEMEHTKNKNNTVTSKKRYMGEKILEFSSNEELTKSQMYLKIMEGFSTVRNRELIKRNV